MSAFPLTCRLCGTTFSFPAGTEVFACPACGTPHGRPRSQGESLEGLRRANAQRAACDYSHAAESYRRVLSRYPEEHEALWGLAMCKYGVEFVVDPRTGERRATLHFLQRRPITEDGDFRLALHYAPEEMKASYQADAEYIGKIQRYLLCIDLNELRYDVFICYKSSNPDGSFTRSYHHAFELYHKLKELGYRVFFAHDTLQQVAGANYEAYIFHALYSAKVMLLVCSEPEQLRTAWVQSEWSRYLERIDGGEKCGLIPLFYDGFAPERMPEEFIRRSLQGVHMGELTSLDRLLASMGRYIQPPQDAQPRTAPAAPAADESLGAELLSIEYELANGEWAEAERQARELIRSHGNCPKAYLYMLLAKCRLSTEEELRTCKADFGQEVEWRWVLRLSDPQERARLTALHAEALEGMKRGEIAQLVSTLEIYLRRREREEAWDDLRGRFNAAVRQQRWREAQMLAEEMTARRPGDHRGYLCLLQSYCRLSAPVELAKETRPYEETDSWAAAWRCADRQTRQQMEGWLASTKVLREAEWEARRVQQREEAALARWEEQRQWNGLQDEFGAQARQGLWPAARKTADRMVALRPEDARGYLCQVQAEYRQARPEDLQKLTPEYARTNAWRIAQHYAGGTLQTDMRSWLRQSVKLQAEAERREAQAAALQEGYDVYLCHAPADASYAQELYYTLKGRGLRVFCADQDLSGSDGEYERLLRQAVDASRTMLLLCTGPQSLEDGSAMRQWRHFLSRMDAGEDCRLIPLYYGFCGPDALPPEIIGRGVQGVRMGGMDSLEMLMRAMQSGPNERPAAAPSAARAEEARREAERRAAEEARREQEEKRRRNEQEEERNHGLKREQAIQLLNSGNWDAAQTACNALTMDDPPDLWLRLYAKHHLRFNQRCSEAPPALFRDPMWQKLLDSYGDDAPLRQHLLQEKEIALEAHRKDGGRLAWKSIGLLALLAFVALSIYGTVFLQDCYSLRYGLIALGAAGLNIVVQTAVIAAEREKKGGRISLLILSGVLLAVTMGGLMLLQHSQLLCLYVAMGMSALSLLLAILWHRTAGQMSGLTGVWLFLRSALYIAKEQYGLIAAEIGYMNMVVWGSNAFLAVAILCALVKIGMDIAAYRKK